MKYAEVIEQRATLSWISSNLPMVRLLGQKEGDEVLEKIKRLRLKLGHSLNVELFDISLGAAIPLVLTCLDGALDQEFYIVTGSYPTVCLASFADLERIVTIYGECGEDLFLSPLDLSGTLLIDLPCHELPELSLVGTGTLLTVVKRVKSIRPDSVEYNGN